MNTNALERLPKLSDLLNRMMLVRLMFNPFNMVTLTDDVFIARIDEHESRPIPCNASKSEIKAEFKRLIREANSKPKNR